MENPNQGAINFLSSHQDKAFVLILTRDDALHMLYEDGGCITDTQWEKIVKAMNRNYPNDSMWDDFSSIVNYIRSDDINKESYGT